MVGTAAARDLIRRRSPSPTRAGPRTGKRRRTAASRTAPSSNLSAGKQAVGNSCRGTRRHSRGAIPNRRLNKRFQRRGARGSRRRAAGAAHSPTDQTMNSRSKSGRSGAATSAGAQRGGGATSRPESATTGAGLAARATSPNAAPAACRHRARWSAAGCGRPARPDNGPSAAPSCRGSSRPRRRARGSAEDGGSRRPPPHCR